MVSGNDGSDQLRAAGCRRFRAWHHLRRSADFEQVYARKASASDDRLLVFVRQNGLGHARLGLSVSKKHGSAVRRNRRKRLIREAFRLSLEELPAGVDIVVVPRVGEFELAGVRHSLVRLASRAARRLK